MQHDEESHDETGDMLRPYESSHDKEIREHDDEVRRKQIVQDRMDDLAEMRCVGR